MDEHSQHKRKTGIWRLNAYVENQASFIRIYLNAPRNMADKLLNINGYNNIGKQPEKKDCLPIKNQ